MRFYKSAFTEISILSLLLIFMEWLFFITKPSFMDSVSWWQKFYYFFTPAWALFALSLVTVSLCFGFDKLLQFKFIKSENFYFSALPMAILASLLTMLLVDNFSYTMFQWGIQNTKQYSKYVYNSLIFLAFIFFLLRYSKKISDRGKGLASNFRFLIVSALLLFLSMMVPGYLILSIVKSSSSIEVFSSPAHRPNIILFSPDGIEADHMGIYGYHRNTTPNLKKFESKILMVENAITNSGKSTGAAVALLTGRLPTSTRVLFPPHILTGNDAEKHLPGILWNLGYKNFQESARFYLDGPDLGMRDAFDFANGRALGNELSHYLPASIAHNFYTELYFVQLLIGRISERVLHLSGIKVMENPFHEVNHDDPDKDKRVYATPDSRRLERSLQFITDTSEPFFMHLHFMNSHCCKFKPEKKYFYKGENGLPPPNNDNNLYDDAVLESDRYFGILVDHLNKVNKLQNTIIVYLSDHGRIWTSAVRVPLLFFSGKGDFRGKVKETSQLIDVAPTLLDYMGVDAPGWMEGVSILQTDKRERMRPAISVASVATQWFEGRGKEDLARLVSTGPPLYGAKRISATYCHRQYRLNLEDGSIDYFSLRNHTETCPVSQLPAAQNVKQMLHRHLIERGFILPKK